MTLRLLAVLLLLSVLSYPMVSGSLSTARGADAQSGSQPVRPAATEPAGPPATDQAPPAAPAPSTPSAPPATAQPGTPPATVPVPTNEEQDETTAAGELLLVNKTHALAADYVPRDLRTAEIRFSFDEDAPRRKMRDEAAGAVERLFEQAKKDGIDLVGVSGYRSYETQREIFAAATERHGSEEAANRLSARPGESEHQTGLAIDVSSPLVGGELTEAFGETEAGRWLAENAADFGFIIRYLKGKEEITGYSYEPWHIRYVGVEHASIIAERGLTLEEYLEELG